MLNENLVLRLPEAHQQCLPYYLLHINLMLLEWILIFYFLKCSERLVALDGIFEILLLLELVFTMLVKLEDALFVLHAGTHFLEVLRVRVVRFLPLVKVDLQAQDSCIVESILGCLIQKILLLAHRYFIKTTSTIAI